MASKDILIFKAFITAINQANVSELSQLMSEDHIFIDSGGQKQEKRENIISGWRNYFEMFPDYKIELENIVQENEIIGAFGSAEGTYNGKRGIVPQNVIKMPAAWRAIIKNGKVKLWQVYADWTEGMKIIEEDKKSG